MPASSNKLWLDDIRRPPGEGWHWARTIEAAKLVVQSHDIKEASLDHDMGLHEFDPDEEGADVRRIPARYKCYCCREICGEVYDMKAGFYKMPDSCPTCGEEDSMKHIGDPDGVDFAKWLVEKDLVPIRVVIHTMNPVGARNIFNILQGKALHLTIQPFDPACRI